MLKDYAISLLSPPDLEEGQVGRFRLEKFVLSEQDARDYNCHSWMNDGGSRRVEPGEYIRMKEGDRTWMSDTPAEKAEHAEFVLAASGNVLITGLGLGMVAAACLRKPEVKHVTVVDLEPDVIGLVGPALERLAREQGKDLQMVQADAYLWEPDRNFDWAWHDVWPTIEPENAPGMDAMRGHYAPYVSRSQECWAEQMVRDLVLESKPMGMGFDLSLGAPEEEEFEGPGGIAL